jgi:hypothetical protein
MNKESLDKLLELAKHRTKMLAKVNSWPVDYCINSLVARVDHIREAYKKEYKGRESHIIIKAYQGVEKMINDCTPEQFSERFPYGKFPELYKNHPRY